MLTEKQMAQLRETLIASRDRILSGAKEAVEFSRSRDRDTVGRDSLDESVEEWMYATELRLKDREKFLLGKVQGALERLENGTIDECEDCSEEIGFARLAARPVTTLCISCKEERELNER
jgi:DnaK suppressor protein